MATTIDRIPDRIDTGVQRREESAAERWARFAPIATGEDYVESLRNRGVTVYLFGERIAEPVDHPIIRPSINALKRTYDLAVEDPELATAHSLLIDAPAWWSRTSRRSASSWQKSGASVRATTRAPSGGTVSSSGPPGA